ncbi:unnamed protein product, partial [Staurois parvus]
MIVKFGFPIRFCAGDNGHQYKQRQGWTDNSWGPQAIGDHGAPVSSPKLKPHSKKAYERYQGHLMGPPTDPGPSGSARVSK